MDTPNETCVMCHTSCVVRHVSCVIHTPFYASRITHHLTMYPCYRDNIVEGKESFPLSWILSENLLHLAMWILAGALLWPIWMPLGLPVLTIFWAILVVVVQILLKKHNCSGCYYYDKRCHLGWGEISSALFAQDSGNPDIGMKLSLFYIVPPPLVLIVAIIFGATQHVSTIYWIMLALYVVLNGLTFPLRKKGCALCAMREVCPGSAAKS